MAPRLSDRTTHHIAQMTIVQTADEISRLEYVRDLYRRGILSEELPDGETPFEEPSEEYPDLLVQPAQ